MHYAEHSRNHVQKEMNVVKHKNVVQRTDFTQPATI
jgi:hypothetical protein